MPDTATLALIVSILALLVSLGSFGVALWVARRDRADVRFEFRQVFVQHQSRTAGPFMGLKVMNRGRRPIKLTGYGLLFSNGMRSQYNPYAIATLPFTLAEGDSYLGYLPKRKVQEDVRDNHAKGVRLSAVYVDTADNQRLTKRFGRGDETVTQLLAGELAPEPTNLDLMDPALRVRTIGQRSQ